MDSQEEQITLLTRVADVAALCCMDLGSNVAEAEKEWLAGNLSRGAYEYANARYLSLLIALNEAGYTEKNMFFDTPSKPEINAFQKQILIAGDC